jgi:2-phosphosulfolactate phosphatase
LHQSKAAQKIVIGSFLNLTALCNWLQSQPNDVLLVCAGWKNNFNLEDTLFAGAVVSKLPAADYKPDDAAIAAADMYSIAQNNVNGYLKKTSHTERLKKLGIEADIEFCTQIDITTAIPILVEDRLVKLAW